MIRKALGLGIIVVFIIFGCVDQLDITTDREVRVLVVEGSMTTREGPHTVLLTESVKYGDVFEGFIEGVANARVSIRDNSGEVTHLTEVETGIYQTPASFRGIIGRSYSLQIETKDGRSYFSLPEEMVPVPEIDSLSIRYVSTPIRDASGAVTEVGGLSIFTHFKDPESDENFYLWKNNGTFQIDTNPELYVNPNPDIGPQPKDCCDRCWIQEQNEANFTLFSDANSNGSTIQNQVGYIEDDGLRYSTKYLVRIEQFSISKEAFQFFDLIQEQLSIDGDIFDPPPATIRGNMIRLDEPDESVIGFFRVSDIQTDSLFLFPSDLEKLKGTIFIPDDCRLVDETATTLRPSYW